MQVGKRSAKSARCGRREEDKPKYVIIWKNVNEIRACQNI
jgi:CRISPR/Cas system-associated endonuclease/helicase Cas3